MYINNSTHQADLQQAMHTSKAALQGLYCPAPYIWQGIHYPHSDLPELLQIHSLFATKYGEEFAAAAACELCPDCGMRKTIHSMWCLLPRPDLINITKKLSVSAP